MKPGAFSRLEACLGVTCYLSKAVTAEPNGDFQTPQIGSHRVIAAQSARSYTASLFGGKVHKASNSNLSFPRPGG